MKNGETVKVVYAGKPTTATVIKVHSDTVLDVRVDAGDGNTFVRTSVVLNNGEEGALHEGQWQK